MGLSRYFSILCALAFATLSSGNATGAKVRVAAAASLADAMRAVATAYEAEGGDTIVLNLAGSNTLARQIESGAPMDLFFSADEASMDTLAERGLVDNGRRRSLLSNTLVVVVGKGSGTRISGAGELARVRRLAMADPRAVPAGKYGQALLESIGVWGTVARKVVPAENVRAALLAVESGNIEAGIVYRTDAAISHKVEVAWAIPAARGAPISYPVAVLKAAREPAAARRFFLYLGGEEAAQIFEKFGFLVPGQSTR